jgi:phosphotriesterase-related protein
VRRAPTSAEQPVSLANLTWVREHSLRHKDNLVLDDIDLMVAELNAFRSSGGATLVELTPVDLGRRPAMLREISRRSGVNIIMGCGHYIADAQQPELADRSVDQIAADLIGDLVDGVGPDQVRAGVIGEIGCSAPLAGAEENVLRAAAVAALETGSAIVVHPGRSRQSLLAHVELLTGLGVPAPRIAVAHVDRRLASHADRRALAETGCFLAFDCFGLEPWLDDHVFDMPMPCDIDRVDAIAALCSDGFGHQILLGQDIAMKHRLLAYGGHGYGHLFRTVATVFRRAGFAPDDLHDLLVTNPAAFFPLQR